VDETKSILKTISNKKNSNKKMNTKSDTWKKLKKDEIEKKIQFNKSIHLKQIGIKIVCTKYKGENNLRSA
jgi:hypothetical protein